MPDSDANADPRSFAQAPLEEAVGRLVAAIRRTRPQVLVTYPREQKGYPHPDHLRTNEISELAFAAAADPARYPEAGEAWSVTKLYYVNWSIRQMRATHDKFLELGMESPFTDERLARFKALIDAEDERTQPLTIVDVAGYTTVRRAALLAHRTQVDPTSPMWFGLPDEVSETLYPFDEYLLAEDRAGGELPEDDLFAGVRAPTPAI